MPELTFSTKGNAAVLAAYDAVNKAQAAAAKGAGQVNEKLQLTGKEAKALDSLQTQIARRNETAAQTYVRKLEEVRRALAGHKNESELLRKETTRLTVEYNRQADAGKRSAKGTAEELGRTKAQAAYLEAQLKKLPVLLNDSEREAREFRREVDLGAASAGKTSRQILGIKEQSSATFGQGAVRQIAAWGTGFLSVSTAMRGITDEMRLQQELMDKRNASQLTVGEARNTLLRTLAGSTDAETEQALAASRSIAAQTGVSESRVAPALGDAISAIGGSLTKAIPATRVASQYMAGSPDEITEFAGSLLDVGKATGTSDAVTNLGFYQLLGKLSRVNKPNFMQQSIPSALVGMGSFGASYRDSGALFAALSNAGADKFGRSSRTASVGLAMQLDKFLGPDGAELPLAQQIAMLQNDPALGNRFFLSKQLRDASGQPGFGASFEKKSIGSVRDLLLNPRSVAAGEFTAALRQIPDLAGLQGIGQAELGRLAKFNSLEPVAQRSRAMASGLEQLQVDASRTGSMSQAERDQLRSILMESGFSGLGSRFRNFTAGLADGSAGLSTEQTLAELREGRLAAKGVGFFKAPVNAGEPENLTPQQKRTVAVLDQLIKQFEAAERGRQAAEEKADRQTTALEKIEENTRGGGGLVGGAE